MRKLKRTEAYCIKRLSTLYLTDPTKNTGRARSTFLFFRACLKEPALDLIRRVESSSISCGVLDLYFGMKTRISRQIKRTQNASPHGIQGEISRVVDAIPDARTSAM